MLKGLEGKFGLPALADVMGLVKGDTGRRVQSILNILDRLAKDTRSIADAISLLETVERLDKAGALQRLLDLLRELRPLTTSKNFQQLLSRLDGFSSLLERLLGPDGDQRGAGGG